MENEIMVMDQASNLSTNIFTDTEAFQKIYDIGKMFASSKLVPSHYQGQPMDCVIAIEMANRMDVSPMFVMQNLYVVQEKPSWSGQACMSLIIASGKYRNVKPFYFGEKGSDERGCRIEAVCVKTGEVISGTDVTIKMAKAEGWYGKSGSKWQTMPEQMLAYRAATFFARVYIPNALMGVYVEGEVEDVAKLERMETDDPLNLLNPIMVETEECFK